jgi:hypothetical protein
MKTFHSTDSELTDGSAQQFMKRNQRTVQDAGGTLSVSRSFYHGPARLVLSLPDDVSPESVLPGVEFEEVENGA